MKAPLSFSIEDSHQSDGILPATTLFPEGAADKNPVRSIHRKGAANVSDRIQSYQRNSDDDLPIRDDDHVSTDGGDVNIEGDDLPLLDDDVVSTDGDDVIDGYDSGEPFPIARSRASDLPLDPEDLKGLSPRQIDELLQQMRQPVRMKNGDHGRRNRASRRRRYTNNDRRRRW